MSKKRQSRKPPPADLSPAALPADAADRQRRGQELAIAGARLLSLRRPQEAIEKLQEAHALLPDDADVAINLGGSYVMQGRFSKAVAVLEKASRLAPDNAMVWMNLAAAYLGRLEISGPRQQEQAIKAYERAIQADADTPNVHYNLGLIYKDRQEWRRAESHFHRALEQNAADRDARYWLERIARLQEEAERMASQAPDAAEEDG